MDIVGYNIDSQLSNMGLYNVNLKWMVGYTSDFMSKEI